MKTTLPVALSFCLLAACASPPVAAAPGPAPPAAPPSALPLGAFSISLSVKDLAASRAFYEKLGFQADGSEAAQNWLILRNGDHVIGLFEGMFPKNMLTFNPGWTQQATALPAFTDVREIQAKLRQAGLALTTEADPASTGPASLVLVDPDGNPILIDQHVAKPR